MKKYGPKKQLWKGVDTQKLGMVRSNNDGMYWEIFDIKLFGRGRRRVLKVLEEWLNMPPSLKLRRAKWIATVNPEFVMSAQKDKEFKKILSKTSLNVVDGIGLIWAREVLSIKYQVFSIRKLIKSVSVGVEVLQGEYKDQVASGADLIVDLVKIAARDNKKIFLLGGWGDRAERTVRNFQFSNSNLQCEWCQGEPEVSNDEVIKKINKFKPDILLVAYGMKKQEFWINNNLDKLEVGLVMGVGRSFDYYSGDLKRAPKWVRKMGMEWLYSLIKEPKRLKRQLVLPKFVWEVLRN